MTEMMVAGDVTGMEVDMWLASLAFIPQPTADMIQSVTVRHSPVACHCSLYEQPTADMIQSVTVRHLPLACHCSLYEQPTADMIQSVTVRHSPVAYVILACMDTAHCRRDPNQVKGFISETLTGVHLKSMKDYLTNLTMVRHGNKQKQNTNAYNKRSRYRSYVIVICRVRYSCNRYFEVRLLVCLALWPVDKL